MSGTDTFTLFGALPPELRLKIWGEALSERSVWAAVFDADIEACKAKGLVPGLSAMIHVGAAPHMDGLACRESRRLMEQSNVKPLRVPELATGGGVYWVDLERTVVWLGHSKAINVYTALEAFDEDVLSRIRHVAVLSTNIKASGMKVFFPLHRLCGGLRTIIIQRGDAARFSRLSPELAAYYATLPDSGPGKTSLAYLEGRADFSDIHVAYSFLEGAYGPSHPALYLVTSEFADRLEGRPSS
ncbi:hypothetical protein CSOJ01_05816 [Colletotrichum sojae]|uniref:2EXR domain-containing protein n=1 Tax=Colletotrichum sojae TaxID=2175907 RepID=A0A8H6JE47_9PEZI|nr:hypothetical protein CSOJ01_05816 [Colletotrichum sojae]